jgi:hypothetical protein
MYVLTDSTAAVKSSPSTSILCCPSNSSLNRYVPCRVKFPGMITAIAEISMKCGREIATDCKHNEQTNGSQLVTIEKYCNNSFGWRLERVEQKRRLLEQTKECIEIRDKRLIDIELSSLSLSLSLSLVPSVPPVPTFLSSHVFSLACCSGGAPRWCACELSRDRRNTNCVCSAHNCHNWNGSTLNAYRATGCFVPVGRSSWQKRVPAERKVCSG